MSTLASGESPRFLKLAYLQFVLFGMPLYYAFGRYFETAVRGLESLIVLAAVLSVVGVLRGGGQRIASTDAFSAWRAYASVWLLPGVITVLWCVVDASLLGFQSMATLPWHHEKIYAVGWVALWMLFSVLVYLSRAMEPAPQQGPSLALYQWLGRHVPSLPFLFEGVNRNMSWTMGVLLSMVAVFEGLRWVYGTQFNVGLSPAWLLVFVLMLPQQNSQEARRFCFGLYERWSHPVSVLGCMTLALFALVAFLFFVVSRMSAVVPFLFDSVVSVPYFLGKGHDFEWLVLVGWWFLLGWNRLILAQLHQALPAFSNGRQFVAAVTLSAVFWAWVTMRVHAMGGLDYLRTPEVILGVLAVVALLAGQSQAVKSFWCTVLDHSDQTLRVPYTSYRMIMALLFSGVMLYGVLGSQMLSVTLSVLNTWQLGCLMVVLCTMIYRHKRQSSECVS